MKKLELYKYVILKALSKYREGLVYEFEEIYVGDKNLEKEITDVDGAMEWFKEEIKGEHI